MTRNRITLAVAVVSSIAIGLGVGYWFGLPPPPWLSFPEVKATYVRGSTVVNVTGTYRAREKCGRLEEKPAPNPLIWRAEIEGSGPEIALYAPQPSPPVLEIGENKFETALPLTEGISPDGWVVALLVTCTGRDPPLEPIRSIPVKVVFLPKR